MKVMKALAAAVVLAVPAGVLAGQAYTISQKGKQFSEKELTVERGDALTFLNDDKVTHHVFVKDGPNAFDSGPLKPGEQKEVTFGTAGVVAVGCAIHPLMKMTVTVK